MWLRPFLATGLLLSLIAGFSLVASRTLAKFQSAETLQLRATLNMGNFSSNRSETAFLEAAGGDLKEARRHLWTSGPIQRLTGQFDYERARLLFSNAAQSHDPKEAKGFADFGKTVALSSLSSLNFSLSEERFHVIYRLRAFVYGLLADNATGPERDKYRAQSVEDMYLAANMNPGDPAAITDLIRALDASSSTNRAEIIRYTKILAAFHPDYLRGEFYQRVLDAVALEEFEPARKWIDVFLAAQSNDRDFQLMSALIHVRSGEYDRGRELVSSILEMLGTSNEDNARREFGQMIRLFSFVLEKRDEDAGKIIEGGNLFVTVPQVQRDAFAYGLARRADSQSEETQRIRNELLQACGAKNGEINYQIVGVTLYGIFQDSQEARFWLERRHEFTDPPMDIQGLLLLFECYASLNQYEEAVKIATELNQRDGSPWARYYSAVALRRISAKFPQDLPAK